MSTQLFICFSGWGCIVSIFRRQDQTIAVG